MIVNCLILYWNSVWKSAPREAALIGTPHSVTEYAAFNRSLQRKTPFEWRSRICGKHIARKTLKLVSKR